MPIAASLLIFNQIRKLFGMSSAGSADVVAGSTVDVTEIEPAVLFLQGSASYLMRALDLEGKVCNKAEVLRRIDDQLNASEYDVTLLANLLYGQAALTLPELQAQYVVAKREAKARYGRIYSQLWCGYAFEQLSEEAKSVETAPCIVVDLGSGEFKVFVCMLSESGQVELHPEAHNTKDNGTSPDAYKSKSSPKEYNKALPELLEKLTKGFLQSDGKEPDQSLYEAELKIIVEAMTSDEDTPYDVRALIKEYTPNKVHFVATSSTRKLFPHVEGKIQAEDAETVTEFAITAIKRSLLSVIGAPAETEVLYSVLTQREEARYEYFAAQQAMQHATDLQWIEHGSNPVAGSRKSARTANLAWGSGSTQGYPSGFDPNITPDRLVTLQHGLNDVKEVLKTWAAVSVTETGDPKATWDTTGKKPKIKFHSERSRFEACAHAASEIRSWLGSRA